MTASKEKYTTARQLNLFMAPLTDPSFRDQQDTMERPFFALSKSRKTPISYTSPKGDVSVEISPNVKYGMATIWDFDILIWCASQINKMIENGEKEKLEELKQTRRLFFQPADLLQSIGRGKGGKDRLELRSSLQRLNSTYVNTNIRPHHQHSRREAGFTWISAWDEETDVRTGHSKGMSITLSEWFFYGALDQRMILSIEYEYFGLKGGYQRWLYRIARKHAHGKPDGWTFNLSTLHEKSGSDQPKYQFKRDLKRVIEKGDILGYGFEWIERGKREDPQVRIYPVADHERNLALADIHGQSRRRKDVITQLQEEPDRFAELVDPQIMAKLKLKHPTLNIADQFVNFVNWNHRKGTVPRDMFKSFDGFLRKHKERQFKG